MRIRFTKFRFQKPKRDGPYHDVVSFAIANQYPYIHYINYISMEKTNMEYKKRLKRPVSVSLENIDRMGLCKTKMARRKEWLGKTIAWNDVISELLKKGGF